MKQILMIATGGTIASQPTQDGLAPSLTAEQLISRIPSLTGLCAVKTLQLCSIDSTDMDIPHWQLLTETIQSNYTDFDGFVICHGTDTLAYTAAALSYMIQHSSKPIVLTGSQKPITETPTDAVRNLTDSLIYASSESACDVVLVFGGRVIAGTRARKIYTKRYDAFESINFPALAAIQDQKIIPCKKAFSDESDCMTATFLKEASFPVFQTQMSSRVFILKLLPGMEPDILPYLFAHYDCILIESFGMGGIPEKLTDALITCLEDAYRLGHPKLAAMATQVPFEGTDMDIYAVGSRMKNRGHVIEIYDMTPEAAAVKLMWLFADPAVLNDPEEICRRFYQPVNYDICPPVSILPERNPARSNDTY